MPRVVIVGGGISGLSTAHYLARGGVEATIIESRPRLGGVIQTETLDGCTLEAGPDSYLSSKPAALELIRDLGLGDQVIGSNDHLRSTFVTRNGRLVPFPDGLMMMVPTRVLPLMTTPLLSIATKARMGLELLRWPRHMKGDESVADFVRAHYGQEAVDYLAEPLLSGIYGGDPRELSVRAVLPRFVELAEKYGSLTRGVLASRAKSQSGSAAGFGAPGQPLADARGSDQSHDRKGVVPPRRNAPPSRDPSSLFQTLKGGLGQLVEALSKSRTVRTGRAETVERTGAGYRVRVDGEWMEADGVVLACEAHSAARLMGTLDGRAAELLDTVGYSSSMIVALVYNATDFVRPPAGFGFLIPKKERRRLVACTWVGTKFPYRVPEGKVVARCFLGGTSDPGILNESDETVIAMVGDELRELAGVTAQPRATRVSRWPRAMPQPTVGHPMRMTELETRLAAMPGLHVAGNAYQGIGIPDCIRMGRAAAEKIIDG